HYDNPRYTSLFNQALKIVDPVKRFPVIHEMQQIDYSDGGDIIPLFPPVIDGIGAKVHGGHPAKTGAPLNNYDWRTGWIGERAPPYSGLRGAASAGGGRAAPRSRPPARA